MLASHRHKLTHIFPLISAWLGRCIMLNGKVHNDAVKRCTIWFSVEINEMRHPRSPWDNTAITEKHFSAICLKRNELPFCWMFSFCLLWAWLVPWCSFPSKAAKLVAFSSISSVPLPLRRQAKPDRTRAKRTVPRFDPIPVEMLLLTLGGSVPRCRTDLDRSLVV